MSGQSLLPKVTQLQQCPGPFWPHRGERAYAQTSPSYWSLINIGQERLYHVPDTGIFHIHASAQHISWNLHPTWVGPHSADTQMQRNLWKVMTQPGFEPGTFLYRGGCSIHWATGLGRCSGQNFPVSRGHGFHAFYKLEPSYSPSSQCIFLSRLWTLGNFGHFICPVQ